MFSFLFQAPSLTLSCIKASSVGSWSPQAPRVIYIRLTGDRGTTACSRVALQTPSETASLPLPPAMALGFVVLLLLGPVGTASRAQPVLTQPPSVSVLPGQTARLSCTLSPPYNISEFGISWYQQRPGQSLQYLLYYNSERDKHKPDKIPDRFSATKDLASNACILIIASACHEDNGSYFCSLSHAFNWF